MRDLLRVIDRGECLRQAAGVLTQHSHREQRRPTLGLIANDGEINGPFIDEFSHSLLRGPLQGRGERRRISLGRIRQGREAAQVRTIGQALNGSNP